MKKFNKFGGGWLDQFETKFNPFQLLNNYFSVLDEKYRKGTHFFIIIKIIILKYLEEIQVIPINFTFNKWREHLKNTEDDKSQLLIGFEKEVDYFLLSRLGFPDSIILHCNSSLLRPNLNNKDKFEEFIRRMEEFIEILLSNKFKITSDVESGDLLGNIYEKYILEENKEKGAFYTPKVISKYICLETAGKKYDLLLTHLHNQIKESNTHGIIETIKRIQSIKILDPSCGTGSFLKELTEIVMAKYRVLLKILDSEISNQNLSKICFKIIDPLITSDDILGSNLKRMHLIILNTINQLYAVDTDVKAISVAKINIWMQFIPVLAKNIKNSINIEQLKFITLKIFDLLEDQFICGDTLKLKFQNIRRFDIIVGNPPYLSSKVINKEYKQFLSHQYKTAVKQFDLFSIFMEKCYVLLSDGGYFGFIIPESFLGRSHFEPGRKLLLENTSILKIDQIKGVFKKPSVSNIIIFYEKVKNVNNEFNFSKFRDLSSFIKKLGDSTLISQKSCLNLDKSKILFITPEIQKVIAKIESGRKKLKNFIEIHRGEEIGKKSELIKDLKKKKEHPGYEKIIAGENISRYSIKFTNSYISRSNITKKNNFSLYFSPKIVIRQLGKQINTAYDIIGQYVSLQTVYNVILKENSPFNYEFILAFLNSKIVLFYYIVLFREKDLFPRILLENIQNFPIVIPNKIIQQEITDFVKKILNFKSKNLETDEIEKKIDKLMFELYDIKEIDINIIRSVINS